VHLQASDCSAGARTNMPRIHTTMDDTRDDTRDDSRDHTRSSSRSAAGLFLSTYALPLSALGLGLGLIAWSVRRERKPKRVAPQASPRVPAYLQTRRPSMGSEPRMRRALSGADAHPAAMTTTGAKLMGVRARPLELG
jgi:hypothetical protein